MSRPRRHGRDVHGVLLLDKPQGLSSNDALQKVKRLFNANRAGHTGALDPLATGMLPVCLGEATKFSRYLLDADKRYRVVAKLGVRTDTSDAEGQVVCQRSVSITEQQLTAALAQFRGEIQQVPSMYSAIKYQGKPLYDYARRGIEVPRQSRTIVIKQLQLLQHSADQLEMEIHCSKGTYIRTLVDDLGELLGCGAHVSALRRLAVSGYPSDSMVTFEQLAVLVHNAADSGDGTVAGEKAVSNFAALDALLLAVDSPAIAFPVVNLLPAVAAYFKNGQPVRVANAPHDGLVRVCEGEQQHFIGIGEIDELGAVAPRRLVVM